MSPKNLSRLHSGILISYIPQRCRIWHPRHPQREGLQGRNCRQAHYFMLMRNIGERQTQDSHPKTPAAQYVTKKPLDPISLSILQKSHRTVQMSSHQTYLSRQCQLREHVQSKMDYSSVEKNWRDETKVVKHTRISLK